MIVIPIVHFSSSGPDADLIDVLANMGIGVVPIPAESILDSIELIRRSHKVIADVDGSVSDSSLATLGFLLGSVKSVILMAKTNTEFPPLFTVATRIDRDSETAFAELGQALGKSENNAMSLMAVHSLMNRILTTPSLLQALNSEALYRLAVELLRNIGFERSKEKTDEDNSVFWEGHQQSRAWLECISTAEENDVIQVNRLRSVLQNATLYGCDYSIVFSSAKPSPAARHFSEWCSPPIWFVDEDLILSCLRDSEAPAESLISRIYNGSSIENLGGKDIIPFHWSKDRNKPHESNLAKTLASVRKSTRVAAMVDELWSPNEKGTEAINRIISDMTMLGVEVDHCHYQLRSGTLLERSHFSVRNSEYDHLIFIHVPPVRSRQVQREKEVVKRFLNELSRDETNLLKLIVISAGDVWSRLSIPKALGRCQHIRWESLRDEERGGEDSSRGSS
jgi:hypothetical protein